MRRVDGDEQSDDEVGDGQVEDEVVAERAQLGVGREGGDDERVAGDRDDGEQCEHGRQHDGRRRRVDQLTVAHRSSGAHR